MTVSQRVAIVAFFGLLLAACWLNFTKVSSDHVSDCGTWFNPGMTEGQAEQFRVAAGDRSMSEFADSYGITDPADVAAAAVLMYAECRPALDTRRNLALLTSALTIVVPGVILFVAAGRRRQTVAA